MTQPPSSPNPYDPSYIPVEYYTHVPDERPRKLIRLAVIFNYISVGLDVVLGLLGCGFGLFFFLFPNSVPRNPGDPPPWVIGLIYLVMGLTALAMAIVKFIGTRKLQYSRPNAWGWGLAVGIVGCAQVICGSCCWLQVAPGIYTIVILCLQDVRLYLQNQSGPSPGNAPLPPSY